MALFLYSSSLPRPHPQAHCPQYWHLALPPASDKAAERLFLRLGLELEEVTGASISCEKSIVIIPPGGERKYLARLYHLQKSVSMLQKWGMSPDSLMSQHGV